MKKIGLFYWAKGGNVEKCAKKIAARLSNYKLDVYSLDAIKEVDLPFYDLMIVGGSTAGADIWENAADNNLWFDFFARLEKADLTEKPAAIFGLGDQVLYPDHFVDGMIVIKNEFDRVGAKLVGHWPTEGYDFTGSESVAGDKFIGLALDEDQQPELTDQRIEQWADQVLKEAGF
jgi:flavodoxin I